MDNAFNDYLVKLASQNLLSFDDYRQEVFAFVLSNSIESLDEAKKAAKRVAMRIRRKQMREKAASLDQLGEVYREDETPSVLWEDNHILA